MAFNLFEAPEYYGGLLGEEATNKLQNKALTTGLINAAIGYFAQPKNQGYGSALPYLGKALAGGYQAGQETIKSGLQDWEQKQKADQMMAQRDAIAKVSADNPELGAMLKAYPNAAPGVLEKLYTPKTQKTFNILNEQQAKAYGLPMDKGQRYQMTDSGVQLIAGTEAKQTTNYDDWTNYKSDQASRGLPSLSFNDWMLQNKNASATKINMPAPAKGETKFQEELGGLMAKRTAGIIDSGQAAPEQIASARRIKDTLKGKVFTGSGAEQILGINNALSAAGVIDPTAGINTEVLSADMAKTTLQNIKSSGLGAGQGFSNADREFLQKASAGQITLNAATIQRIADLNERAGIKSIEKYNDTVRNLPPENRGYYNLQEIDVSQYRPKAKLR